MKNRKLGRTELMVSPIGLGCWQFSNAGPFIGKYWDAIGQDVEREIVERSLAGGINWFDTAEAYGLGRSEQGVAAALSALGKRPGDVIIATKWLPIGRFAGSITRTIDKRIGFLAPFPIDLYQIHFPASFSPIPAQLRKMAELVRAHKIRAVGVSNFNARQLKIAHKVLEGEGIPLASNQVRYSMLDRAIERNGVLETARELGVSIIAYSPLEQGILTGRYHEDPSLFDRHSGMRKMRMQRMRASLGRTRPLIEELRRVGQAHGASPAEVALNWLVTFHGDAVLAIPGASKRSQAEHNVKAMSFELTKDELGALDELARRAAG